MNGWTYILGPTVAAALGSVVTLWVKKRTVRVELDAKKEGSQIDAPQATIQFLREELGKRDRQLMELQQLDREDRRQHAEALTAIKTGIEAIANRLDASAHEARENAKVTNERLLVIETQLGIKRGA